MVEVKARQELTRPVIRAIKEISGKHYWRVESFNDDPTTTHRDLLRVLDCTRLIIVSEIARTDQPRSWYLKFLEKIEDKFAPGHSGSGPCPIETDPVPVPVRYNNIALPDEYARPPRSRRLVHETSDLPR